MYTYIQPDDLEFSFSSFFLPYCGYVVTSQLLLVKETDTCVPVENNRLIPIQPEEYLCKSMSMKYNPLI